jgi:hypothetical protein
VQDSASQAGEILPSDAASELRTLDWLDRACAERNPALIYIRRDLFGDTSAHPRVGRIVRAMKFPD